MIFADLPAQLAEGAVVAYDQIRAPSLLRQWQLGRQATAQFAQRQTVAPVQTLNTSAPGRQHHDRQIELILQVRLKKQRRVYDQKPPPLGTNTPAHPGQYDRMDQSLQTSAQERLSEHDPAQGPPIYIAAMSKHIPTKSSPHRPISRSTLGQDLMRHLVETQGRRSQTMEGPKGLGFARAYASRQSHHQSIFHQCFIRSE